MDEFIIIVVGGLLGGIITMVSYSILEQRVSIEPRERLAIANNHAHYDKKTGDLVWDNLEICSYLYRRECE